MRYLNLMRKTIVCGLALLTVGSQAESEMDLGGVKACFKAREFPSVVKEIGAEESADAQWLAYCTCVHDGTKKPSPFTCRAKHMPESFRKTVMRSCMRILEKKSPAHEQVGRSYCACDVEERVDTSLNGSATREWNCGRYLVPLM
jgi:hypothetical protein